MSQIHTDPSEVVKVIHLESGEKLGVWVNIYVDTGGWKTR